MHGLRILFVDDDFISNMGICEVLRENHFIVVEVYCALAAYEALRSYSHLAALVTDIDLGPGEDGFAVARKARAVRPTLPVVYISGASAARFAREGVADAEFIAKPFHPQEIADALRRVIRLEAA